MICTLLGAMIALWLVGEIGAESEPLAAWPELCVAAALVCGMIAFVIAVAAW